MLYGGSYGGYMVLAGLAFQPERWAAGDRDRRDLEPGHLPRAHGRLAARASASASTARSSATASSCSSVSPLTHVDEIRAPLFIIHGANDPRVPVGEARQIHRSLTERGDPCELNVYDDEGHGLKRLSNRLDAYPKAVAFLERVLAAPA